MKLLNIVRKNRAGALVLHHAYCFKENLKSFFFKKIIRRAPRITMRPGEFRQGLVDLINSTHSETLTIVEIGSYRGESAQIFLSTGKVSKIFCVDPWLPFYDKTDIAAYTNMEKVEQDFDKRFESDSRVVKAKGTIDDFIKNFCNSTAPHIDIVYIDGCHSYAAVQHDINSSLKCIHPTLAIAGHDYFGDVKTVVDETWGCPDKIFSDSSWIHFLKSV